LERIGDGNGEGQRISDCSERQVDYEKAHSKEGFVDVTGNARNSFEGCGLGEERLHPLAFEAYSTIDFAKFLVLCRASFIGP
jgi:hypothetical protein